MPQLGLPLAKSVLSDDSWVLLHNPCTWLKFLKCLQIWFIYLFIQVLSESEIRFEHRWTKSAMIRTIEVESSSDCCINWIYIAIIMLHHLQPTYQFPVQNIIILKLFKIQTLHHIQGGSFFFLIWLSRRYDSTMVEHRQNANGPMTVHNLAPPRQPN